MVAGQPICWVGVASRGGSSVEKGGCGGAGITLDLGCRSISGVGVI